MIKPNPSQNGNTNNNNPFGIVLKKIPSNK